MSLEPNLTMELGGTLRLEINPSADAESLIGTEFHIFEWNRELAAQDRFDEIVASDRSVWDMSRLYDDGRLTLLAAPLEIDELATAIRSGSQDPQWDLNGDGHVDADDQVYWVTELRNSFFGDSNLDGEFSSDDLVWVFQLGQYEDEVSADSIWGTGDWNGDQEFDTHDFLLAFQHGGYEQGPRDAVAIVPECTSGWMLLVALPFLYGQQASRRLRGRP